MEYTKVNPQKSNTKRSTAARKTALPQQYQQEKNHQQLSKNDNDSDGGRESGRGSARDSNDQNYFNDENSMRQKVDIDNQKIGRQLDKRDDLDGQMTVQNNLKNKHIQHKILKTEEQQQFTDLLETGLNQGDSEDDDIGPFNLKQSMCSALPASKELPKNSQGFLDLGQFKNQLNQMSITTKDPITQGNQDFIKQRENDFFDDDENEYQEDAQTQKKKAGNQKQ
ncbi:hypothetical protein OXYTRIMIC_555 [Oxytricha trifallax]|uniref:Uncharacterized protein n=1 Tax=Oxytricha trifallax TaxID=1172189 RepID=A0A073I0L8_9SPIT|nr:hypothetical protein OXYTRIMIC_555 [Oxytricha trifallax]